VDLTFTILPDERGHAAASISYNEGLSAPRVTVIVPTLAADSVYEECLAALAAQRYREFECVIVDNSGEGRVREGGVTRPWLRVIREPRNVGFGAAVNHAIMSTSSTYVATLNDDAIPAPGWLEALVEVMESDPSVGMCASRIRFSGGRGLDSAGMLLAGDGSSKQRGHLAPLDQFQSPGEVFFPSACAAMYRRNMLDEIGLFDEEFFLYCEDTDLGLRARWAGWKCWYVPAAEVVHRYSHSAGRASPLKAYLVERNRIFVALKNLPLWMLWKAPAVSLARYFWHAFFLLRGRGVAAEYRQGGGNALSLAGYVLRAHGAALRRLPRLWASRKKIRKGSRITPREFAALARRYSISARQVAAL